MRLEPVSGECVPLSRVLRRHELMVRWQEVEFLLDGRRGAGTINQRKEGMCRRTSGRKSCETRLTNMVGGGGGKNWKKAGVTINLSSGMRLPTWTSFVGSRIDVRRGRGVSVKPANKC